MDVLIQEWELSMYYEITHAESDVITQPYNTVTVTTHYGMALTGIEIGAVPTLTWDQGHIDP